LSAPKLVAAALVALAACASAPDRQAWEPESAVSTGPQELDLASPPASDLPDARSRVPSASEYPPPPGARLLATAAGPQVQLFAQALSIPPELWLPAAPDSVRRAVDAGEGSAELLVDASADLDVDGDGVRELVLLGRPAAAVEAEHPVALLLALARTGNVLRLLAAQSFAPQVHEGHVCHAEWRLAGSLRRGRADVPLVFEERGVNCSQRVGGGFDRAVYAVDLGHPGTRPAEAVVARARLGAGGSADLHEANVWAADLDGDGDEELVVRGISSAARPCGAGDPPFWLEELAFRVVAPGRPPQAWRGGRVAPAPEGILPPQLLASHPAACGMLHPPPAR
jgi:hypothetical protein